MRTISLVCATVCIITSLAGSAGLRAADKKPCCDATVEAGKKCEHKCCVKAAEQGKVCEKCHPKEEKH